MSKLKDKWIENPGGATPVEEVPTGTVDGANTDFVISQSPLSTAHLEVYLDGIKETNFSYNDVNKTITFSTAPELGQDVLARYAV